MVVKNAQLVYKAFSTVKRDLNNINVFHTDRGNEFKYQIIDEVLKTFNIQRLLSAKGCPYGNTAPLIYAKPQETLCL